MLSLNIGFSKKQQGNEPYSSIGASCNLSVEASDELVKDPELLQKKMAFLFAEARRSVDHQIVNGKNGKPASSHVTENNTPRSNPGNGGYGNGKNGGTNGNWSKASAKQLQFVVSLARKNGGLKKLQSYILENFGIEDIKDLTKKQASVLIEKMKGGDNG